MNSKTHPDTDNLVGRRHPYKIPVQKHNIYTLLVLLRLSSLRFLSRHFSYRIVSLSRYFLCVRNDIPVFAWHLRYANMIDSPPFYSSFSTLLSHAVNDRLPFVKDAATAFEVPCHRWSPWPEQSSWRHNSQLPACVYVVAFKFCWVWIEH